MRKKACLCKEGWTGPHCKQREYKDDDARGPIRLPVFGLEPPPWLGGIMAAVAIVLTWAVFSISGRRENEMRSGDAGGYRAMRG